MFVADERVLGHSLQTDRRVMIATAGRVGHTSAGYLFTTAAVREPVRILHMVVMIP